MIKPAPKPNKLSLREVKQLKSEYPMRHSLALLWIPAAIVIGLYHFDEGRGDTLGDSSGAAGGSSDGFRRYGGDPYNGPEWFTSDLDFLTPRLYLPLILR